MIPEIEWSILNQYLPNEVECRCGAIYATHTKSVRESDGIHHYRRVPCPGCGVTKDSIRRISSPPENWTL
jgi:hypothetical protein